MKQFIKKSTQSILIKDPPFNEAPRHFIHHARWIFSSSLVRNGRVLGFPTVTIVIYCAG